MKYLESYKLFERVTVPDIETTSDENDTKGCGNCLAAKSGKPLKSLPKQTSPSSDDSQNSNKPTSGSKKIESPYNVQKRKFFEDNPSAEGLINSILNSSKKWYTDHYMKPETLKKFKKRENRDRLVDFINKEIKLAYWNRNSDKDSHYIHNWHNNKNFNGWVFPNEFDRINLNMERYKNDGYKITIPHELGHCIYHKLEELGEDPISGNKDANTSFSPKLDEWTSVYDKKLDDRDWWWEDYSTDEKENQTRIMSLRRLLNIGPQDTCEQIKQKFQSNIKNGKLKFDYLTPSGFVKKQNGYCYWLKLGVSSGHKEWLLDKNDFIEGKPRLFKILSLLNCSLNGESLSDFALLFSVFSQYKDGFIWLDLSKITQLNLDVVTNDSPENFDKMG